MALSEWRADTLPSPTFGRYVPYFLARVGQPDQNGCLPWLGSVNAKGYGVLGIVTSGHSRAAHRFAYEYWVGPIPSGLTIDHRCYNRVCLAPDHLEPVTQAVNASRRRAVETCVQGHEMTEDNTYYSRPSGNRIRPQRHCRACTLKRQRERYALKGRKDRT